MSTAAIIYKKDGYNTGSKRLLGRQSASEGFLKALVSYNETDCFYCYTDTQGEFNDFCQHIRPWVQGQKQVNWVNKNNLQGLIKSGILYRPDPVISELLWQRRYLDQKAYSICGVTHTVASKEVMKAMGDLLIAPMQPWDAVICTSVAVKEVLQQSLQQWSEYLAERLQGRPNLNINLPVIPLGIDCDFFPQGEKAKEFRHHFRKELGIDSSDIVVLFVGRLIFHAKAHPVPMYMALEKAAQQTGAKVHLIQAGWFEDEDQEFSFKNAASLFAPSVNNIFLDGRQPLIRQNIWSAADIFISLADNIQETFGLTPIEAMAAGLPVVVSDWNGYKETVRHEVDGFKIPTLFTPDATGLDIAAQYYDDSLNYPTYIGYSCMMTAVDIDACAHALSRLIESEELRQRLGENARARARQVYDWQVIIKAYENLWHDLNQLRNSQKTIVPRKPEASGYPLCEDPSVLYAHYPTQVLNAKQVLSLGSQATAEKLEMLTTFQITSFGGSKRLNNSIITNIIEAIAKEGSLSVEAIEKRFVTAVDSKYLVYLHRTLMYLIKFDVLRVVN